MHFLELQHNSGLVSKRQMQFHEILVVVVGAGPSFEMTTQFRGVGYEIRMVLSGIVRMNSTWQHNYCCIEHCTGIYIVLPFL